MESVLKNVYINKIQIPKFHGHIRLELQGCRENEVVEHDNHMTDALEQIIETGLWETVVGLWKTLCPTYKKAFGGILLTDKSIPDDSVMLPGGIEVTACGSYNVVNNDSALTQGSYNVNESVLDWASKKMTYVYDWTTNQGNGTIAAAALCNAKAGLCGYGDSGISINGSTSDIAELIGDSTVVYCAKGANVCLITDQYQYAVEQNNNTIIVTRYDSNRNSIAPFSDTPFENVNTKDKINYKEFKIESDTKVDVYKSCTDGTKIYFWNYYWLTSGSTGICTIIDTSNMTVKTIELKNTIGDTIRFDEGFMCYQNYLYTLNGNSNKLIEINMSNTSDIKEYPLPGNRAVLNTVTNALTGKIFMMQNGGRNIIFDCITKTIKASKLGSYGYNYGIANVNPLSTIHMYMTSGNNFIRETKLALYLATISNLDKPVQKTADKTMKVTYTIQQE